MPRVFAAIEIPPDVRAQVAVGLAAVRWPDGVRAIPAERWHLTLAFCGEVPQGRIRDCLIPELRLVASQHDPLRLQIAGAGSLPNGVVFLQVVEADDGHLARLARSAWKAGRNCGAPGTDGRRRPYRPHITVGRRRDRHADLEPLVMALNSLDSPVWQVNQFALVESTLGPSPRYEVLATFPFSRAVRDR